MGSLKFALSISIFFVAMIEVNADLKVPWREGTIDG
jgi:hypothetical protein